MQHNHIYKLPPPPFPPRPGTNPPQGGMYGGYAPPQPAVYNPNAPAISAGTATGVSPNTYHGQAPPATYAPQQPLYNQPLGFGTAAQQSAGYNSYGAGPGGISSPSIGSTTQGNAWSLPAPTPGQTIAQWQATPYGQQQNQYTSPPPVSYTPGGNSAYQPPPAQGYQQQQQQQQQSGFQNYVPHLNGPHATGKPAPPPPQPNTQTPAQPSYGRYDSTSGYNTTSTTTTGSGWQGDGTATTGWGGNQHQQQVYGEGTGNTTGWGSNQQQPQTYGENTAAGNSYTGGWQAPQQQTQQLQQQVFSPVSSVGTGLSQYADTSTSAGVAPTQSLNTSSTFPQYYQPQPQAISQPPTFTASDYNNLQHQAHSHTQNQIQSPTTDTNPSPWQTGNTSQPSSIGPASGQGLQKQWTQYSVGQQPQQPQQSQQQQFDAGTTGSAGYGQNSGAGDNNSGTGLGIGRVDTWDQQQQYNTQQQALQQQYTHPQQLQNQPPSQPTDTSSHWDQQQTQPQQQQNQPSQSHGSITPAISSSVFSGGGGFSNWEHFGVGVEEVDDEAILAERTRKREEEKQKDNQKEAEEAKKKIAKSPPVNVTTPTAPTHPQQPQQLQSQPTSFSQGEISASPPQSPGFPPHSILQQFHRPPSRPTTQSPGVLGFGGVARKPTMPAPGVLGGGGSGGGGYWPEIGNTRLENLGTKFEPQPKKVEIQKWPEPPAEEVAKWKKQEELQRQQAPPSSTDTISLSQQTPISQSATVSPATVSVPPKIEEVLPALSQYVHKPDGLQQKQSPPTTIPTNPATHPTIVSVPKIPTPPPPPPKPIVVSAAVQTDPVRPPTPPPPPPPPPPPEFNVPSTLDEWYKNSIHRYITMVLAESSAKSENDKLKVFTDFMMDETTIRGAKYSGAVGEEEKLARVERRGTFWGDGDYRHLYGGGNRPGKEGGVELDEYLSSDDEGSEDGGGALGGIGVELERELGILGDKDSEKEPEEEVKPLFAGKGKKPGDIASTIEKEKPHLGEGMVQKAKEIQRNHTPLSLQEEKPKEMVPTQEPVPKNVDEPIIAPLSPRKESAISYIPPLSPATKQPKPVPSSLPISSPTKQHSRTDSFGTPPTPGVSQYKPFRPSTPPAKLPLDISSPSPGVSAYQAYHPPTKTSPKVAPAKPVEGYKAYRPPSGSIDAGKRTSWIGTGPSIPIARPVSTIGVPLAAPAGFHPPDRRMTMTTSPSLITAGPGIVSGVGPRSSLPLNSGPGEFQPPKRTHTMAWDTAGDVVAQAHPGPSGAKPIGGFFAIPGLDTAPERGRQIERGRTPLPYPVDDAPPAVFQPQRAKSPGFQRTASPAALEHARNRANSQTPLPQSRSRASSQAPLPPALQTRSRASSQAPLPAGLQTRSRANSQAPPYPSKSLTPQPQTQGPFRKPDSPAPASSPLPQPAHVPSPALAASQPAAAAVLAALNTTSGRRTVTPTQQQFYTPPILPNSPQQKAVLSPPPAAQKYGTPDSPRSGAVSPRQQQGMYQPPPPRAISPGIPLNATPTPPVQQSIVQSPRAPSPAATTQVKPSTPAQQQPIQPPPVQSPVQQLQSSPAATTVPAPQSASNPPLSDVIANLRSLLPAQINSLPDDKEHLLRVNNILASLPPDFSYIIAITKDYNALAAETRAKAEDARRQRQEAHDKAVDSAYTAKDIGYGDLATLDEEFKETEAKQKQEEDKAEYDLYANEVFGKLYQRLQDEINTLLGGWGWLVNVAIKEAAAGRSVWEVDNGPVGKGARRAKPNLIEVLATTLKFYHAIEMRYAKITEALVERDRRYKKMICGRLYENGEVKKMKEQEKHFEKKEKEALHSAAKEKKARTLEMWAKVEGAMMNGLEEDLAYTESLTLAVKGVLAEIPATDAELTTSRPKEFISDAAVELDKAYRVLDELSGRSLRLFEIYYEGGMEAAKADFEEKVSGGKASGAVRKEEMDEWEKEKKAEEDRMGKELHERKTMVGGEWNGLREGILGGVGRLRGVLAGPEKKEEVAKKEEQPVVKQASPPPQKGVWGWFK